MSIDFRLGREDREFGYMIGWERVTTPFPQHTKLLIWSDFLRGRRKAKNVQNCQKDACFHHLLRLINLMTLVTGIAVSLPLWRLFLAKGLAAIRLLKPSISWHEVALL